MVGAVCENSMAWRVRASCALESPLVAVWLACATYLQAQLSIRTPELHVAAVFVLTVAAVTDWLRFQSRWLECGLSSGDGIGVRKDPRAKRSPAELRQPKECPRRGGQQAKTQAGVCVRLRCCAVRV